jgi:hypothetical protein
MNKKSGETVSLSGELCKKQKLESQSRLVNNFLLGGIVSSGESIQEQLGVAVSSGESLG